MFLQDMFLWITAFSLERIIVEFCEGPLYIETGILIGLSGSCDWVEEYYYRVCIDLTVTRMGNLIDPLSVQKTCQILMLQFVSVV
jgi:hypothetical protein